MSIYKIYLLRDPLTQKIRYIGKTTQTLKRRLDHHIHTSKKRKLHSSMWVKSLLSKGEKPLIELILICTEWNWKWWERWFIKNLRLRGWDLTNISPGGDAQGKIGKKGENHHNTGKKLTKEHKENIRKGWENVNMEEFKRNVSKNGTKIKNIYCLHLESGGLQVFKSILEASLFTNIDKSAIGKALKGKLKLLRGYKFSKSLKEINNEVDYNFYVQDVYCYTLEKSLICICKSIAHAARTFNIKYQTSISNCCHGKLKRAHGFIFSFTPLL